jgi:hypothetical protein
MTQPIPSETIEYERYVDGLRRTSADLVEALERYLDVRPAFRLKPIGAPGSAARQEQSDSIAAEDFARAVLAKAQGNRLSPLKTITVHLEGGLVHDVTGIPAGYEVRVEDHDEGDTSHPSWDAEKGCFVTVFGGEGA